MGSGKPLVQRNLAALVKGAHGDRERLSAGVALVEARTVRLALHERGLIDNAAMRADRAVCPEALFEPRASLGFSGKDRILEVGHGVHFAFASAAVSAAIRSGTSEAGIENGNTMP